MTPVRITWHDAFADVEGWMESSDIDAEPCVVQSVGFLIPDAKPGHVTLAQSMNSHDDFDSVLHVPVGMVVNVLILS